MSVAGGLDLRLGYPEDKKIKLNIGLASGLGHCFDDQSWLKSLIVNDDGVITGFTPKREKPDENKKQLKLKKEQLDEQEQRLLRQERMLNRREQHLEQQQQPIQQQLKTNTNQPVTKTAATNEQVDHHQLTNAQSQKILKVPLYNGSNVNVDKFLLRELKTEWQNNPKHVTRLLLIDLVGKEELKTMTRTGKNNRKPIPEVFMIAIEGNLHVYQIE
ncbi:hypothetical protein HCN44_000845 [Aphidius gifuensis]|uniref:Uncharacterized protein n=1 Tax=Aphidius gifuensis TaxID=684658 RepID=A0A835CS98_APHGI|nr:hypothetical protein HCN44_000845 [Aphidius gifuensis]